MYQYQKNGRQFQFFVVESTGVSPVGKVEVYIKNGKITDFETDDLPTKIYDAICNSGGRHQTLRAMEAALKRKDITPR